MAYKIQPENARVLEFEKKLMFLRSVVAAKQLTFHSSAPPSQPMSGAHMPSVQSGNSDGNDETL
jgi:hypothetical protein